MENNEKTIEENFKELEEIVSKMQNESISLEESFALYKKGVGLVEECNKKIDKVRVEIEKLNTSEE